MCFLKSFYSFCKGNKFKLQIIAITTIAFTSCKKFVEIAPPKTRIVSELVFANDATAVSALRGIYSEMMTTNDFASGGPNSVTVLSGLSSDEFIDFSNNNDKVQFYTNSLEPSNVIVKNSLWGRGYKFIYYANSVLEGLQNSTGVSSNTKKQLEGEAKFIRAFFNFYLLNLFGDIPLIITTDYRINSVAVRTSKAQVYDQIIKDLIDAKNLLPGDYSISNNERVRPNKWAATALFARVYLYLMDWGNAEAEATIVINNSSSYSLLSNLNSVFLKNSMEAIFQLKPVQPSMNTFEGNTFIPITSTIPLYVSMSSNLLDAFEVGDKRRVNWVANTTAGTNTYYYPYKFKIRDGGTPLNEYSMVLRLAEQYLIRAEARAQQNNIGGSQSDLNVIRNRAGLLNTTSNDKSSLLLTIEHERQVELFAEWGHRWFDLKRTERANIVLSPLKTPNWQSTDVSYPIPQSEIQNNSNLSQNQGY